MTATPTADLIANTARAIGTSAILLREKPQFASAVANNLDLLVGVLADLCKAVEDMEALRNRMLDDMNRLLGA